ncbi:MAG: SPOR domain-containing protein [Desulfotignum sp.]
MSFNGVLKYIIYGFIGAWLFLLGVMAGRETAPVTFDTQNFQERLKTIVDAYVDPKTPADPDEKMALRYYDALSEEQGFEEMMIPVPEDDPKQTPDPVEELETAVSKTPADQAEGLDATGEIPVKTGKKAATFNKAVASKQRETVPPEKQPAASDEKFEAAGSSGRYTIQVAAFKSFRDAVTQMAELEKKGFTANRTAKELDGITWYRVRIGAFASRDAAARYLDKLNQAGINGMIITRE